MRLWVPWELRLGLIRSWNFHPVQRWPTPCMTCVAKWLHPLSQYASPHRASLSTSLAGIGASSSGSKTLLYSQLPPPEALTDPPSCPVSAQDETPLPLWSPWPGDGSGLFQTLTGPLVHYEDDLTCQEPMVTSFPRIHLHLPDPERGFKVSPMPGSKSPCQSKEIPWTLSLLRTPVINGGWVLYWVPAPQPLRRSHGFCSFNLLMWITCDSLALKPLCNSELNPAWHFAKLGLLLLKFWHWYLVTSLPLT